MKKWLVRLLVLSGLVALDRCSGRNGLDAEDILAVRPGMTMDEVDGILGRPLDKEVISGYSFYCPCNAEKTCWIPLRTTWRYARKPVTRFLPFTRFPMLWVHFNARGRVDEVYAKVYFMMGMDSEGIYVRKLSPCDTTDRTLERFGDLDDETMALERLHSVF